MAGNYVRVRLAPIQPCKQCGKEFQGSGTRKRTFCCAKCYHEAKRNNGKIEGNTKQCARCSQYKTFDLFPKQPTGRAGCGAYCLECNSTIFHELRGTPEDQRKPYKPMRILSFEEKNLRIKERSKLWREQNRDRIREWNKLRHHRQRAAGPTPHRFEIQSLLCLQDARCSYCKDLLSDRYHIDHKTPVSRGGTNNIENLQVLCPHCNMSKGALTDFEFLEKHGIHGDRSAFKSARVDELDLLADTIAAIVSGKTK